MSPSNLSLSASSFINSICTCIILYPILMLKASISPCLIHQGIESTEAPVRPPVPQPVEVLQPALLPLHRQEALAALWR